jgi:hypothetical protein
MYDDKLERLLEKLFTDDDVGEVSVLKKGVYKQTSSCCCTYNYTAYGG